MKYYQQFKKNKKKYINWVNNNNLSINYLKRKKKHYFTWIVFVSYFILYFAYIEFFIKNNLNIVEYNFWYLNFNDLLFDLSFQYFFLNKYLMTFGDINFIIILFFFMFATITINVNTALHLLLTAEFLWITLYILALTLGFIYDNLNILSLTFFFLILSAVEFGLGLVIILIQNILLRSIHLNDLSLNFFKFSTRFQQKLNLNSPK